MMTIHRERPESKRENERSRKKWEDTECERTQGKRVPESHLQGRLSKRERDENS